MARFNLHRLLVVFAALCAVFMSITAFAAAPPDLVNYQGRLLKSDATPVTDGSHLLRFSLWDDSTGGAELWSETQTVSTAGGLFTTALGKATAFPEVCAPCDLWLQTQVQDGGSSSTLLPRQRLMSVPYSLVSGGLEGESNPSSPGSPIAVGKIKGGGGGGGGAAKEYHIILEADTDGDGIYEHGWDGRASTDSGASTTMSSDPNEDGHPDHLVTMSSQGTKSSLSVANIGSSGQDGVSVDVGGTTSDLKVLSLWGLPPGEPVTGTLLIHTDPDHSSITMGDETGDGRAAMTCYRDSVVDDHSALDSQGYGGKTRGMNSNVRSTVLLGVDRALRKTEINENCDTASAGTRWGVKSGSTTGTIRMVATPDSLGSIMDVDLDGDGNAERKNRRMINADAKLSTIMSADSDDDGVDDITAETVVDNDSASFRLNGLPPGTPVTGTLSLKASGGGAGGVFSGHSGSTTGTIRMAATPDSGSTSLSHDNDNDGISETTNSMSCDAIESRVILKGRSGSTTGTIRMAASHEGGVNALDQDSDDDGVVDMSAETSVDNDSATFRLNGLPPGTPVTGTLTMKASGGGAGGVFSGHSGSTTGTIRMAATPDSGITTSSYADATTTTTNTQSCDKFKSGSILKGMSGSTTGTIRMAASADSAGVTCDHDDDNDGVADRYVSSDCDDTDARLTVANIGSSGQDGVSIDITASSRRLTVGNLGSSGNDGVRILVDGSGSRMGVDTIPTTKAITVGGGAYCDGTNWVNASDKNAKENFKAVNGEEILEKIEGLPISQWNYKTDDADVKHIGPTAQDFKSAFGVGADDKSISTVDPSGIALAAIKQLIKENEELRARIAKLEKSQAR